MPVAQESSHKCGADQVYPTFPCEAEQRLRIAMIGTRGSGQLSGGVELAVDALSRSLAARGHTVLIYSRNAYATAHTPQENPGIVEIPLPHFRTKYLEAISHSVLASAYTSLSRSVDIVHFHAVGPSLVSPVTRVRGIATVSTVHALDWQRDKWPRPAKLALNFAGRVAATVPHQTIAVSRPIQSYLDARFGASSHHIPNGVEFSTDATTPVPELSGHRFILFLGRLVPEKEVHTLIQAFRCVQTPTLLAIVGEPSHTDDYHARLQELASEDGRVLFLGARYGAEKNWLLQNSAGFVQPSTVEGLPIALLEAMASGARVVVSDIPAHREILVSLPAADARVFRPRDVKGLTAALAEIVDYSPLRSDALSAAARAAYNWSDVAAATEAVYGEALRQVT